MHDFFIVTERKKRSADIVLLEKQKKEYDNYVALADKAKELIEQKRVKDIDLHADESLHDRGVITSEHLKILIEDHTGKKTSLKHSNKDKSVVLWLDVQVKKAFVPQSLTIVS